MKTIEAEYRITTPMFCSGADQTKAELRLPSFKGALRFWWRSLMWSRVSSVADLHEREAALFGSSDQNVGQSKVRLQIDCHQLEYDTQQEWRQSDWQKYSGYGLIETTQTNQRQCIKPESRFKLSLRIHPSMDEDITLISNALEALGTFGGLGGRSRMGWGSIQLDTLTNPQTWHRPETKSKIDDRINTLLSNVSDAPPFTAFSSSSQYAIGPEQRNPFAAHKWISCQYRDFIRRIQTKSSKEAFGLPRKGCGPNADKRRSGAIFIHIHQLQCGKGIPIALALPATFLPNQPVPSDAWRAIDNFVKEIQKEGQKPS